MFVCKVHPYMLAGVIVDDPANPELEMGETLHLVGVTNPASAATVFPSNSNLALRLLRAFFIVTSPSNWKDYTKVTTLLPSIGRPIPQCLSALRAA